MEFLTVPQAAELLRWSQTEVLTALRKGVLAGVQVPKKPTKWAVVHPGVMFVDYIRNPESRLPHIGLLSIRDVMAICHRSKDRVKDYVRLGYITPIPFPDPNKRQHGEEKLFTPWEVRRLIKRILKTDPWVQPPITEEAMKEFFKLSMVRKVPSDPLRRMDEEIRYICETPEPERTQQLTRLVRMAEAINKQQCEALTAEAEPPGQEQQNAISADVA